MNQEAVITVLDRAPRLSHTSVTNLLTDGVHAPTLLLNNYDGQLAVCSLQPGEKQVRFCQKIGNPWIPMPVTSYQALMPRFVCGFKWEVKNPGEDVIAIAIWHEQPSVLGQIIESIEANQGLQHVLALEINDCKNPRAVTTPLFEGIQINPEIYDPFNL